MGGTQMPPSTATPPNHFGPLKEGEELGGGGGQKQHFWGLWGAHGLGYMGLVADTWVPMGARVPVVSPNDHPNPSQRREEDFGKGQNKAEF